MAASITLDRVRSLRLPSSNVLGLISLAGTIGTAAATALGVLPSGGWIVLLAVSLGIFVGAVVLHFREARQTANGHPIDELKQRLAEVDGLRTWLNLREDPDERLPLPEDRIFQWAKKTHKLMQREFPADADAFMGETDAPLGSAYFATAYVLRRDQMSRSGYLESRAKMVREILQSSERR